MSIYRVARDQQHPVDVVEELLEACDGVKDEVIEGDAQLSRGMISKLRKGHVEGPQITTIAKLAGALGYRLRLEKIS